MEDLPDDVIISNIDTFRNIIKQQKNYVDEMQIHLSNKDKVIEGLQQTIRLLESTIESNQELIEKLRTEEKESSINDVHHVYDITNELHILEQLDEKEQIISEMLITYIPREKHALELRTLKEQHVSTNEQLATANEQLATANEQLASTNEQLASTNEQLASTNEQLASTNEQLASTNEQIASTNEQIASIKEQHVLELATANEQLVYIKEQDLKTLKEQHVLELAIANEQLAFIEEKYKEKLFPNSSSIKDKIKKKYIKKELEIYKNENIALKNQIEFFKNMVMMGSLYNLHRPPYDPNSHHLYQHNPHHLYQHSQLNQPHQPSQHSQPSQPSQPHQPHQPHQPPYNPHDPHPYQSGEPHRSNVKTTEQKKSNNENQHKNKMGNVLEQLQQLQKQKQIL